MNSEQELVDSANKLADIFYTMLDYISRSEFKFYNATHPTEVLCWNMAVEAYQHINGTDINNALTEIGE